ncbi:hypothetical protein SAMN02983003_0760 [Devosia enhydra]|uniref:Uncharacterized protein n=1 Tax=Devosia enhydra TaxID=665118 RepID=A0A1K2HU24_9HYPH|nr:hypothetical protein [Devosia enhydra]SFZ81894.1 hypothetical protein SAMN02983003_0760 [Devosia enhydra]
MYRFSARTPVENSFAVTLCTRKPMIAAAMETRQVMGYIGSTLSTEILP